jgi:cytochrome c oxidase cbb3-type subunit 3
MQPSLGVSVATCLAIGSIALAAAQAPPQGRGGGGRQGGGNPNATFPAQQRAPGDPALVARGQGLYGVHCRACHGVDLRGGDIGGPNLLRSQLALNDLEGELMGPVITQGKQTPGMPSMPAIPLSADDVKAVAAYIHSVQATMRGQGSPPPGTEKQPDILVGDAKAGEAYFRANCSACHSPTGDLQGVGRRFADPVQLQNAWVAGGARGRGAPPPGNASRRQVTAVVTLPNGQTIEGRLDRIDDFIVVLTTADGQRSFGRTGEVKVEVRDPLEQHRKLLAVYADRDIHNVTAYLVTLK